MSNFYNESIYLNQSIFCPSLSSQTSSQDLQSTGSFDNYFQKQCGVEKTRKIKKQTKKDKKNLLGSISTTCYGENFDVNEDEFQQQSQKNEKSSQIMCQKPQTQQLRQCIVKDPVIPHKYLIIPNIVIDFDQIKEGIYIQDQNTLRLYRQTACVNYLKNLDMIEMEIGINSDSIKDFSFICNMLDSLGDQKAHSLAQALRQYDSIINQCQQEKKKYPQQNNLSPNDLYKSEANNSSTFSFAQNNQEDDVWNFEKSRQKAYKIIQNIMINNPQGYKYMYFRILRGSKDSCEMFSQINSREYLQFLLGTNNIQQIIQIILRHGMLSKKTSVDTFQCLQFSGEQFLYDTFNSQKDSLSNNYDLSLENTTINDCTYAMDISFTKLQLSNYKDRFNDYLLIISPKKYDNNFMLGLLLKRLEEQKQAQQMLQQNYMDIQYQAQSEVFVEKFYQDKINNNHA
ncbi:hypothetical protein TTHERM_01253380 (macronuclear) [Tetrahymena thermophila SB210]|uniref:Uncharacterized protein n=1 Tax=Tetrahymena thermophila (strain SB210) TaxID=312017 RepID=Q22V92_TETTS|nr:hypothetical protein TTHERM_01253380 [Tetrahymena thermophila SB210]EAR89193.1 hypothetical protein TTHERM_01253380 [Tetrahymena thermophila SB210]|eukprot:XP_001009438.1 hypothetical protein TTHERM_01253380 [Tetrahymena thermophila SB210]